MGLASRAVSDQELEGLARSAQTLHNAQGWAAYSRENNAKVEAERKKLEGGFPLGFLADVAQVAVSAPLSVITGAGKRVAEEAFGAMEGAYHLVARPAGAALQYAGPALRFR